MTEMKVTRQVIAVPMGRIKDGVRVVDIPMEDDGSEWGVVGAVTFGGVPYVVFEPPSLTLTATDKMIPFLEAFSQKMLTQLRESEERGAVRLREAEERMDARWSGRRLPETVKA